MSNLKKFLQASFLISFESVLRKVVGVLSTLILVRLIMPEDFGIVALAMLILGFFEVLKANGAGNYLLRSSSINDEMINTAWTIGFITSLVIIVLILLSIPFAISYFNEPRLEAVMLVFAMMVFFKALGNPGLFKLKRDHIYLPIIKLALFSKIIGVIVTIAVALIYRNYWALIAGQFVMAVIGSLGGHFIYKHKMFFTLANIKDQFAYSSWTLLSSITGYLKGQIDTIVVSSLFNVSSLGSYHTLKYLSYMPYTIVIEPIMQPLLVQLAKIKDIPNYFQIQYTATLIYIALFSFPIFFLVYFEHYLITDVILGSNWVEYSSLLKIFSLSVVTSFIGGHVGRIYQINGNTRVDFVFNLFSLVVIYSTLLLVKRETVEEFAQLKVSLELILIILYFFYTSLRYLSVRAILVSCFSLFIIAFLSILSYFCASLIPLTNFKILNLIVIAVAYFVAYLFMLFCVMKIASKYNPEWNSINNFFSKLFDKVFFFLKSKFRKV